MRVTHFDIRSEDPEKTAAFCSAAFGWTLRKWNGPFDYWLIATGEPEEYGIDGGLSPGRPAEQAVLTIATADLDARLLAVAEAGGKIVEQKALVPRAGWFATVRCPGGNLFRLMEDERSVR